MVCSGHPQKLFRLFLGRKMLSALGLTAADATNTAQIWPPRDPVGPNCYGAYCQNGGWSNYGYTQAVPADGNPNLTPDGYMRPVPLARPMVSGRH